MIDLTQLTQEQMWGLEFVVSQRKAARKKIEEAQAVESPKPESE